MLKKKKHSVESSNYISPTDHRYSVVLANTTCTDIVHMINTSVDTN